jgi:hypothetical protein
MRNEVRAKPNINALANSLKLSEILQDSRTDKFAMQLFFCEHLDIDEDRNIAYLSNTVDLSTAFKQMKTKQYLSECEREYNEIASPMQAKCAIRTCFG